MLDKLPFVALAAASSAVTFAVQQQGGAVVEAPISARLAQAVTGYVRYLAKTAWPLELSAYYPSRPISAAEAIACFVLLAAITALAMVWRERLPALLTGWLWFGVMLGPVIGLVQLGDQAIADRYTYLPSMGLMIAVVFSLPALAVRAGAPIAALLLLLLSVRTTAQIAD